MVDPKSHWEGVYRNRPPDEVSWYQTRLDISLDLIRNSGAPPNEPVVDVGGGASTLVDDLLESGFRRITVVDLSAEAIRRARTRLGERAAEVTWVEGDVTAGVPGGPYRVWHDRAVFHFLTQPAQREAYRAALDQALAANGQAVIATFGPDGPEACSGLPVVRYSAEQLAATLGSGFRLLEDRSEVHRTPAGKTQHFIYCRLGRTNERHVRSEGRD